MYIYLYCVVLLYCVELLMFSYTSKNAMLKQFFSHTIFEHIQTYRGLFTQHLEFLFVFNLLLTYTHTSYTLKNNLRFCLQPNESLMYIVHFDFYTISNISFIFIESTYTIFTIYTVLNLYIKICNCFTTKST